jgi:hypothetical protein
MDLDVVVATGGEDVGSIGFEFDQVLRAFGPEARSRSECKPHEVGWLCKSVDGAGANNVIGKARILALRRDGSETETTAGGKPANQKRRRPSGFHCFQKPRAKEFAMG